MIRAVFLVCAALALSACDTWATSNLPRDLPPQTSAPADPGSIVVTQDSMSGGSYTALGELRVSVNKTTAFHPAPTREMVIEKLREDAARLGANAVINAKVSEVRVSPLSWGTRTGTGTAVRLAH